MKYKLLNILLIWTLLFTTTQLSWSQDTNKTVLKALMYGNSALSQLELTEIQLVKCMETAQKYHYSVDSLIVQNISLKNKIQNHSCNTLTVIGVTFGITSLIYTITFLLTLKK